MRAIAIVMKTLRRGSSPDTLTGSGPKMELNSTATAEVGADEYRCRSLIDQEAREYLSQNYDKLWRHLRHHLRSDDDTDDVLHAFCLRVLRSSSQIQKQEAVQSWISKVLRTTLIDHYRRCATETRCWKLVFAETQTLEERRGGQACPYLCYALPMVAPDYASLIRRIDVFGEARAEVSQAYGISTSALAVRLFRARAALRKSLFRFCESECDRYGTTCTFVRANRPLKRAGRSDLSLVANGGV